jgi:hypothetical protein
MGSSLSQRNRPGHKPRTFPATVLYQEGLSWLLYSSQVIVCLGNTWYKGQSRLGNLMFTFALQIAWYMSCCTDSLLIVLNDGLSVVHTKVFNYSLCFSTHFSAFEVKEDLTRSISLYRLMMFRQVESAPLFLGPQNYARSQNCEKRLLASSYVSVCLPVRNNSVPTGRIFTKFDIWIFFENLSPRVLNY